MDGGNCIFHFLGYATEGGNGKNAERLRKIA